MSAIALVTGGANGIGRAIVGELRGAGMAVVVFDRDTGDVGSEADVERVFESIRREHGRLDVAVNCAGVQVIRPVIEMSLAEWDAVIKTNLTGTFLVGREAARMMLGQESGGRIINIASELAYAGRANYSAYCATKGAILSLTRAWARELAPRVLVNAVAPGPTETAMVSLDTLTPEERQREIESVPLGRIARPYEIAGIVGFLAGPKATYFTGQCVSPSGGAVML